MFKVFSLIRYTKENLRKKLLIKKKNKLKKMANGGTFFNLKGSPGHFLSRMFQ
jgi:hypothetical protein